MVRILANVLGIMCFIVLPYWCTIILLIINLFLFDFVEIVFYGFLFDVIYAIPGSFLMQNFFLLSSVVLYAIIFVAKPYIKLHNL